MGYGKGSDRQQDHSDIVDQQKQNQHEKQVIDAHQDVLDAQQTRFTAEDNLALVDLNILTNRVNLHRALGGSWAVPEPIVLEREGFFFDFKTRDTTYE